MRKGDAKPMIGVLNIQGSVKEHMAILKRAKIPAILVKNITDLNKISGLIIPGGESTVISKLLKKTGLDIEIKNRAFAPPSPRLRGASGGFGGLRGASARKLAKTRPLGVFGTCAGAIILAKKVKKRAPATLGLIDIEIARNAYGSQLESFETDVSISIIGGKKIHTIFIRAPKITKTSGKVEILAEYQGETIMAQQKNILITTFHPELTKDTRIHKYFYSLCKKLQKNS